MPPAKRFEIEQLSPDFLSLSRCISATWNRRAFPSRWRALRKAGLKFDIMTTSFFLGRRTLKPAPNSGMPQWQDQLFIALAKQAASAPDFFKIPSDRVVELGAQMKV